MKKVLLLWMMLCITVGALAQRTNVSTLKIYRAKVDIKRPIRERYFRGSYHTFKKGEVITESTARFYTIKNYNNTYYLYGGELDSDYTSSLIPKANVSIESYQIGKLPVSAIGDGKTYTHDGVKYDIFIAKRNGHKFIDNEYGYNESDTKMLNSSDSFCVLTAKSEYGCDEYIMPIKNGYVQIPELLENYWVNFSCDDPNPQYSVPSFNSRGELIKDMYITCDKPSFFEPVCYIPSKNALYLGDGFFMPLK